MSTQPLGIAIAGTGWVAGAHIETFKKIPDCAVVAVSSRDKAKAQQKIAAHGLRTAMAFNSYDAMLRHPGVDVVVLCTPHGNHPDETIRAAQAKKHIVIEKPVALDRPALLAMCAAVAAAGVQTSVCFELRWIGLFQNIKALVAEGRLGKLFYGESAYFHGIGPWYGQYHWNRQKAMGGDAFLTAGCHALDGLIWLMGSEVQAVSAMANLSRDNPLAYEYETNVAALLQFKDGAIGKCSVSIECRQPYHFPLVLQGDRGSIVDDKLSTLDWPGLPKGAWARIPAAMPDSGDVDNHPYLGQLQYFVDCIRSGKRPHNDLASCAHVHEVMFAVQDAIRSGRRVEVPATPGCTTLLA
jgi:predicted dehydrogenase